MSKSTVITLNTYLQGLPSHHQCRSYVQIYIYVFKILRQTIVEQSEVEIITLMEVKIQEQAVKFSACVLIIFIKVQMKCFFFIPEFERAAKIRKIAVYRFLISFLVPEL